MFALLSGLGLGFSLIIAIGAQNAFVLKQGLKQQYIFWVCLICSVSDTILIYLGVTGFAKVLNRYPEIIIYAKYFGATFLFIYGIRSFYSAFNQNSALKPSLIDKSSLMKVIGVCLAFTWLNPHVYLDTVILVGSISVSFKDNLHLFTLGVILASWLFFFSLGYGAKFLSPLFNQNLSWKILDLVIGVIMWSISFSLIFTK
ncbi:amino acid transporter [Snodgrassella alvi]|uniref:LysE/ArgO family amino acid transporter n=1 Tax=Snodgrassella alvi TaxID=1196083 RepID=UPI000A0732A6|nr:LysE/ArgO family amino acid transporter [Snodgrassella alvi]ORF26604.1 amino acid transporter [Snodgrassella alvi]ORF31583.1 amino acid transporter [Snodgrassella alvi]ORF36135.1 amino acid transporter [Snodgrassella alvi]ORF39575.1 amino acid transporter [Snodgrassella alvi]ORF40387.1 amino acid transporter [Snodgrassella alvi]